MNELLNALIDQVDYSSKIDELNSSTKSELLMIQKSIVSIIKDAKVQVKSISDDDIDRIGLAFSEKLVSILRK